MFGSIYQIEGQEHKANPITVSTNRIKFSAIIISLIFLVLVLRVLDLNFTNLEEIPHTLKKHSIKGFKTSRADIVDRNGNLLASNIITASVYAHPKHIIDVKQASSQIAKLKIGLNEKELIKKLSSEKGFVWIKRHITPKEQQKIHDLGIPGIYFRREEKRVYPYGNTFSHIVGYANIDGKGIAGLERMYDEELQRLALEKKHLQLSLDVRIQNALRKEIQEAIDENSAIGAAGLVMDVNNGEILGIVSLPDFNPHYPEKEERNNLFNRNTLGVYEMGSTFKPFTIAMGLDLGKIHINNAFDVSKPLKIGRFSINDYRGKGGTLSVPEILKYSSNLGVAQIGQLVGIKSQKSYLRKLGFFTEIKEEIPETSRPLYPNDKNWQEASLITISYGHGLAATPLHLAQAFSCVINGGILNKSKLLLQKNNDTNNGRRVFKKSTSDTMRKLLTLVAQEGSARKANINEYIVGGKTGTSEKNKGGKYNKKSNIAIFIGAFPMNKPQYLTLVMIDEAKTTKKNFGFTTGGMVAAPVGRNIIEKIAPILSVQARNHKDPQLVQAMHVQYTPRYTKKF